MNNLLLVQVVDKYGPNSFLPLAISYQWMYAQTSEIVKNNFTVSDVIIEKKSPKKYVESIDFEPHVVALSSYVWNWNYNRELSKEIKKKYPNCLIITGGPNVDKRDVDFFKKNQMFDIAVLGEGEIAFKEILERYLKNENYDNIPHVFPKSGKLCEQPSRLNNLEIIPSPILSGFYDWIIEKVENEIGPQIWQVTYETLRGCPYKCAFCDIGDEYWQKIKTFDLERVYKEIDWMSDKKIEYVSVCDSNWGMMERDKDITKYVIQKKLETGYPKFWDVTWAKSNVEQIYEIATMDNDAKSRLFKGITFAMQSFNTDTLLATNRFNLKQDKVYSYLQKYREQNISTYSELIWPMPNETYDTLKIGIQKLIDLGQKDFLMVHPLVLTYNATMGQPWYMEKHGLKYETVPLDTFYLSVEDLENYIVEHTWGVRETNTASEEDVFKGHSFSHLLIVLYYYGWGHYLLEYLFNKYGYKHIDVIEKMLLYFTNTPETLIGSEIKKTDESLKSVFYNNGFWGRQVLGENDIFWEYKSATSIVFHQNRETLRQEFLKFINDEFNMDLEDVVQLNMDMCFDYRISYPMTKKYSKDALKYCLNLEENLLYLNHYDSGVKFDEKTFYHTSYHYQRKNRYWRCHISELQMKPL